MTDGFDGAQDFAGVSGEQEVDGFGCGDEDVGGVAGEAGALVGGGVAGAYGDGGLVEGGVLRARGLGDADEGRLQVALDIDGEGFDGGDVEDAAALVAGGTGANIRRSMHHRKAVRVLPVPVGARMRVDSPRAMAGQPRVWGRVGSGKTASNQARTGGWKRSRGMGNASYGVACRFTAAVKSEWNLAASDIVVAMAGHRWTKVACRCS